MNCREFEEWVAEAARGRFENTDAAGHAETCERCAARLVEQRWLSEALGELAA